jgi:ribonuclease HII
MLLQSYKQKVTEAGCDESGRGCLAGPVVAAAVILPAWFNHPLLNDSKQVSPANREILRAEIESTATAWAIGTADNSEIDSMNILNASILAMHRALSMLRTVPEHIIVDGNRFKNFGDVPHICIVKGDSLYMSIAAASILAKTHRDKIMQELHIKYPVYGWQTNKGYPTGFHASALRFHGPCEYHRKSFKLTPTQLRLEFGEA